MITIGHIKQYNFFKKNGYVLVFRKSKRLKDSEKTSLNNIYDRDNFKVNVLLFAEFYVSETALDAFAKFTGFDDTDEWMKFIRCDQVNMRLPRYGFVYKILLPNDW